MKKEQQKHLGGRTKPLIRARYEFVTSTSFLRVLLELIFVKPHVDGHAKIVLRLQREHNFDHPGAESCIG